MKLSSQQLHRPFHVSTDHQWVYLLYKVFFSTNYLRLLLPATPVEVCSEEEDAHFSKLLFRGDFLSEQYFGENHPISIITEKAHFGEGMHRRAFRTTLKAGQIPLLVPGHACVLKVHNAISYGTKNNDELVQKNFNLAVEVRTSQLATGDIFFCQTDRNPVVY